MDNLEYVIWSNEHQAWWRPLSNGYTRWIEDAGRYPLGAAMECSDSGNMHRYDGFEHASSTVDCETMMLAPESLDRLQAQNKALKEALRDVLPLLPIGFAPTGRPGGADAKNEALAAARTKAIEALGGTEEG